jgi:hypothetical protein
LQLERQLTVTAFARNIEQMQVKMQNERQSLMESYNQTMSKLDRLIASQRELNSSPQAILPINCKYCGTKVEKGAFCPKCGKANY